MLSSALEALNVWIKIEYSLININILNSKRSDRHIPLSSIQQKVYDG